MIRWSIYTCFLSYKLYNGMYVLHDDARNKQNLLFLLIFFLHIFFNIQYTKKKCSKEIDEILIDGSVSQIIDLHPSFDN